MLNGFLRKFNKRGKEKEEKKKIHRYIYIKRKRVTTKRVTTKRVTTTQQRFQVPKALLLYEKEIKKIKVSKHSHRCTKHIPEEVFRFSSLVHTSVYNRNFCFCR